MAVKGKSCSPVGLTIKRSQTRVKSLICLYAVRCQAEQILWNGGKLAKKMESAVKRSIIQIKTLWGLKIWKWLDSMKN